MITEDAVATSPPLNSLQHLNNLEVILLRVEMIINLLLQVEVVIYVCEETGTCKVHQFVYQIPLLHQSTTAATQKTIKLKVEL